MKFINHPRAVQARIDEIQHGYYTLIVGIAHSSFDLMCKQMYDGGIITYNVFYECKHKLKE